MAPSTPKHNPQEDNELTIALSYITNQLGLTDTTLNRKYGMNRCTLSAIRKGGTLVRNRAWYLREFLLIINDCRLHPEHYDGKDRTLEVDALCRRILMAEYNV